MDGAKEYSPPNVFMEALTGVNFTGLLTLAMKSLSIVTSTWLTVTSYPTMVPPGSSGSSTPGSLDETMTILDDRLVASKEQAEVNGLRPTVFLVFTAFKTSRYVQRKSTSLANLFVLYDLTPLASRTCRLTA